MSSKTSKNETTLQVAEYLLQIKAVRLNVKNPFTWSSGWKSPIYCDNRITLSYPKIRSFIKNSFVKIIQENFSSAQVIAGVAAGAIAQGALVAEEMKKPFVYVRSSAKGHGMENLVEGELKPNQKVVVIEDLISTGKSSLEAVKAIREKNCEVIGLCAIFTYGFKEAEDSFAKEKVLFIALSSYEILIQKASEINYIRKSDLETLKAWRKNPEEWGK